MVLGTVEIWVVLATVEKNFEQRFLDDSFIFSPH